MYTGIVGLTSISKTVQEGRHATLTGMSRNRPLRRHPCVAAGQAAHVAQDSVVLISDDRRLNPSLHKVARHHWQDGDLRGSNSLARRGCAYVVSPWSSSSCSHGYYLEKSKELALRLCDELGWGNSKLRRLRHRSLVSASSDRWKSFDACHVW